MKCLVTGGAGFIGSHLVDLLLKEGHSVIAIDNLSVGNMRNLENAMRQSNFEFHLADVFLKKEIESFFIDVEIVYHLAGLADIVPSIENPDGYFNANVIGTYNVAQLSAAANVKKVVYAASSSCYGIPEHFPTSEESTCNPQYPYALTKYLGEQVLMHWNLVYDLPVNSLRLFNVYGPRARTSGTYGAVFGVFLAQKLAGKPFTRVGDGNQTRDFTYISDVTKAFYMAGITDKVGLVMNVGSGGTYSINRVIELLGGPVVTLPKRPGEPDSTFADISKIRKELSWEPSVDLSEGISKLLEHIEDWKDAPLWDVESIEQATKSWFKSLGR